MRNFNFQSPLLIYGSMYVLTASFQYIFSYNLIKGYEKNYNIRLSRVNIINLEVSNSPNRLLHLYINLFNIELFKVWNSWKHIPCYGTALRTYKSQSRRVHKQCFIFWTIVFISSALFKSPEAAAIMILILKF